MASPAACVDTMVISLVSCLCPFMRVTLIQPLLLSKLKITKAGGCVRTGQGQVLFWDEEELSIPLVLEEMV